MKSFEMFQRGSFCLPWRLSRRHVLRLLALATLLSGCTATTGDRVTLNKTEVGKIHNLGVTVRCEQAFSVYYSRDRMSNEGAALGGLLGAAIESSARASSDEQRAERLMPELGDFNPQQLIATQLTQKLQAAGLFNRTEKIDDPGSASKISKQDGLDGLLVVTVQRWGVISCPGDASDEKVEAGFQTRVKMMEVPRNAAAWDRNDLCLNGTCHPLSELAGQPGLLRSEMTNAVDELTDKLVNTIRFPQ